MKRLATLGLIGHYLWLVGVATPAHIASHSQSFATAAHAAIAQRSAGERSSEGIGQPTIQAKSSCGHQHCRHHHRTNDHRTNEERAKLSASWPELQGSERPATSQEFPHEDSTCFLCQVVTAPAAATGVVDAVLVVGVIAPVVELHAADISIVDVAPAQPRGPPTV